MNKEQRKLNLDPNAMNMESLEVETYNNIQWQHYLGKNTKS